MIDTDWEHAARERLRTFDADLAAPPVGLREALIAFACLWWPGAFGSDSLLAASDAFRMFAERGTPVDPAPEWDW